MTVENEGIRLLVRGDDFGSTHAANLACIDCYRHGMVRSVEIMVPCPWFEEGAQLLNEHPGLDVGVHLVLTSEWTGYRWRPLTRCPGITDEAGYFLPRVWPADGVPESRTLVHASWRAEEVEAELRAQIELCLKRVPHVTHLTCHMGWENAHVDLAGLLWKLSRAYGFEVSTSAEPMTLLEGYDKSDTPAGQVKSFTGRLERLTPGTWMFIEHPAYDHPEMEGIHHTGYQGVGRDRGDVTRLLMSPDVVRTIEERGIRLISYRDLRIAAI